jgi:hypothetical protein
MTVFEIKLVQHYCAEIYAEAKAEATILYFTLAIEALRQIALGTLTVLHYTALLIGGCVIAVAYFLVEIHERRQGKVDTCVSVEEAEHGEELTHKEFADVWDELIYDINDGFDIVAEDDDDTDGDDKASDDDLQRYLTQTGTVAHDRTYKSGQSFRLEAVV